MSDVILSGYMFNKKNCWENLRYFAEMNSKLRRIWRCAFRPRDINLSWCAVSLSQLNAAPPNLSCVLWVLLYVNRLKKLNLISLSYWLEIKDIVLILLQMHVRVARQWHLLVHWKDLFVTQPVQVQVTFLRPNVCRTALLRNSFFNRIVYLWHQLPRHIKLSTSFSIFRYT